MEKLQKISTFLTITALLSSFFFDTRILSIMAFILIFSIGILHGANDIQILKKVELNSSSFYKLFILYLLTVLAVGLLFFLLPKLALLIFVLISGYHFGEQHFHGLKIKQRILKYLFFGAYGLSILLALLYTNAVSASEIILQIADIEVTQRHLLTGMLISVWILVISAFVLIYQGILQNWVNELLYLLLFYVLFQNSSLIWGFAIYFAIWHSLPSLLDQ
jgi:Brp/Blh family beta-carotene 15,15'-monooxygenase